MTVIKVRFAVESDPLPSESCCGAAFFFKVFNTIEWVALIKTVLVDL